MTILPQAYLDPAPEAEERRAWSSASTRARTTPNRLKAGLRNRAALGTWSRLTASLSHRCFGFLLLCACLLAFPGPALGQAPANDNFAQAAVLTGLPASATGSNVGATYETGEPDHINVGNRSVWWKWTAPAATLVVVDTIGSSFDTLLDVYVGDGVTNLTVITSNDDWGVSGASQVSFMTKAGTSYAISVSGYRNNSGDVVLNLATLAAPSITSQPEDATNYVGSSIQLSVEALGQALEYTWFEGQSGDTNTPVAVPQSSPYFYFSPASTTSYWVRVSNATGFVDSRAAAVTVKMPDLPRITSQPQDATNYVGSGSSVQLSVGAVGQVLSYTWFEGQSGETNTPVAVPQSSPYFYFSPASTTSYWVRVSNAAGFVDSRAATVTVRMPDFPVITIQPTDRTNIIGLPLELSIAASSQVLNYQWFEGTAGATNLPVANYLRPTNSTSYWVRVSNAAGFVDSRTITVTAIPLKDALAISWNGNFGKVETGTTVKRTVSIRALADSYGISRIAGIQVPDGFSAPPPFVPAVISTEFAQSFEVSFSPTQKSGYTGDLVLGFDVPDTSIRLPIHGEGADPSRLAEIDLEADFGTVQIGRAATRGVRLRNVGASPIPLAGLSLPDGFQATVPTNNLAWGEELTIPVSYVPTAVGDHSGTMQVSADLTSGLLKTLLHGRGSAATGIVTVPTEQPTINLGIDAAGVGDTIRVLPGAYSIASDLIVSPYRTLAIEGGTVLNFETNVAFTVAGTLTATGSATNRIVFTCAANPPVPGGWRGLDITKTGDAGTNSVLDQVEITFAGTGITVSGSGPSLLLTDSLVAHSRSEGMAVVGSLGISDVQILDSVLWSNGTDGISVSGYASGCASSSAGVTVEGCEIAENGNNGIRLSASGSSFSGCLFPRAGFARATIRRNIIHHNEVGVYGGGFAGYRSYGVAAPTAENNLILSNRFAGVLLEQDVSGTFVNNVISGSGEYGVLQSLDSSHSVEIRNNIVVNNGNGIAAGSPLTNAVTTHTHNLVFGNTTNNWQNYPAEFGVLSAINLNGGPADPHGNISADPRFVGPGDYHLQVGSPCIDAGVLMLPGRMDFSGSAPDIGAFEPASAEPRVASRRVGDNLEVYFNGVLQSSAEVDDGFTDTAEQQNPLFVSPTEPVRFWRARSN